MLYKLRVSHQNAISLIALLRKVVINTELLKKTEKYRIAQENGKIQEMPHEFFYKMSNHNPG
jgi:hypothetical protein